MFCAAAAAAASVLKHTEFRVLCEDRAFSLTVGDLLIHIHYVRKESSKLTGLPLSPPATSCVRHACPAWNES